MRALRKLIALLLVFTLAFTVFAGCGRGGAGGSDDDKEITTSKKDKTDKNEDKGKDKDEEKDKDKDKDKDIDEPRKADDEGSNKGNRDPGRELYYFYEDFDTAMKRYERAVNSYESNDFTLMMNLGFDYISPALTIVDITLIEAFLIGESLSLTGVVSGFDTVRERKGDIISYNMSKVNEENGFSPDDLAGDAKVIRGTLDTKKNALKHEILTEREGKVILRTVCEIVQISDGSYLVQLLTVPKKPTDDRLKHNATAYFYLCGKDKLEIKVARMEPDYNFKYNSIIDNPNTNLDALASNYELLREFTMEKDEVIDSKNYE